MTIVSRAKIDSAVAAMALAAGLLLAACGAAPEGGTFAPEDEPFMDGSEIGTVTQAQSLSDLAASIEFFYVQQDRWYAGVAWTNTGTYGVAFYMRLQTWGTYGFEEHDSLHGLQPTAHPVGVGEKMYFYYSDRARDNRSGYARILVGDLNKQNWVALTGWVQFGRSSSVTTDTSVFGTLPVNKGCYYNNTPGTWHLITGGWPSWQYVQCWTQ